MNSSSYLRWAVGLIFAAALVGVNACAQAIPAVQGSAAIRTECMGYYTIELPGEFEYALMSNFSQGLGAWGSEIRLDLGGFDQQELIISQPATEVDLKALVEMKNREQQQEKDRLLDSAKWRVENSEFSKINDPDGSKMRRDLDDAARVSFYQFMSSRDAAYFSNKDKRTFQILVNNHILSINLLPRGTPEQTLDAFLSHYKPRALGELPSGPGVCIPYGFFTDERQPATIGLNIRLKAQPDIVVFLLARDAASDAPEDPRKLLDGLTPTATFFGSRKVTPIHAINPLRTITIDGNEGLGSFVRVTRKTVADQSRAFNNAAEKDEDWGYFAYIPGNAGGKPGESFNLEFKVERFGRFANQPMSEREFRELVMRLAASIKRRSGAWQVTR